MATMSLSGIELDRTACVRAIEARDPRFDGVFFVGITSTHIYCRPICPARVSHPENRRFFGSAAAAERAGFRPCLRCRPELAPGRGIVHAVSRLARAAAGRIAAGALNRGGVPDLARELHVSERHLRRALGRELGVSPMELAQTHRLHLAKRLLADTALPVSRVAEASGFQSLRRFNAVFRDRYRMPPTAVRRGLRRRKGPSITNAPETESGGGDFLELTLGYRAPMSWEGTLIHLGWRAVPAVEQVDGRWYGRTVRIDGRVGVVLAEDVAGDDGEGADHHVGVRVSISLLPVLMPLIAQMRRLLDLDAEPAAIDECLAAGGLEELVRLRPGLRAPGTFDPFEGALVALLHGTPTPDAESKERVGRVVHVLGDPLESGIPGLERLFPAPEQVAEAGPGLLMDVGIPGDRAQAAVTFARLVAEGSIPLDPVGDPRELRRLLLEIEGIDGALATLMVMRGVDWPDAFPVSDPRLGHVVGAPDPASLLRRARGWRPWRAYAAHHLWLWDSDDPTSPVQPLP